MGGDARPRGSASARSATTDRAALDRAPRRFRAGAGRSGPRLRRREAALGVAMGQADGVIRVATKGGAAGVTGRRLLGVRSQVPRDTQETRRRPGGISPRISL